MSILRQQAADSRSAPPGAGAGDSRNGDSRNIVNFVNFTLPRSLLFSTLSAMCPASRAPGACRISE
jgi:hypothetical protein